MLECHLEACDWTELLWVNSVDKYLKSVQGLNCNLFLMHLSQNRITRFLFQGACNKNNVYSNIKVLYSMRKNKRSDKFSQIPCLSVVDILVICDALTLIIF